MGLFNKKQMFILPLEVDSDITKNEQIEFNNEKDDFYIVDSEWDSDILKNKFKRYKFENCKLKESDKIINCNIHLLIFNREICFENKIQGLLEFEVSKTIDKTYFENRFKKFEMLYDEKKYKSIKNDKVKCNIEDFLKIIIGNIDCKSLENCIYNFKTIKDNNCENICKIDSLFVCEREYINMDIYFVMLEFLILEKTHLEKLKDMLKNGWDLEKTKLNNELKEYYSILYKIENVFEKTMFYDISAKEFNNIKQDLGIYEIKHTCEKNIDRYANMLNIDEKIKGNQLLIIINSITFALAFYQISETFCNNLIRVILAISTFFFIYIYFKVTENK